MSRESIHKEKKGTPRFIKNKLTISMFNQESGPIQSVQTAVDKADK
jgi:hypothetical protein